MTANRPEGHDRLGPPPRTLLRETPDTGWWTHDCNAPCHRCTRPPRSIFGAAPTIRARRVPCSRVAPGRGDRARIRLLRRAGSPGARWRRRRRRGDPRRREATSRERGRRSLTAPPRRSLCLASRSSLIPHWHKASGLTQSRAFKFCVVRVASTHHGGVELALHIFLVTK